MARIAFNGRFSGTPQPTGTHVASFFLFDGIFRANRNHECVVFTDETFEPVRAWKSLPGVTFVQTPFQEIGRMRSQLWEQFSFRREALKMGCTIGLHPMTTSPFNQKGLKTVVTLHDLNFYLHPEWMSWKFRMAYKLFALPGMRKAARVVCVSERTRELAEQNLDIPARRFSVVYNGIKQVPMVQTAKKKNTVLCVGSLQPHKNLPRVLEACERLRQDFPDLELRVVGRPQANFQLHPRLAELLNRPWVHRLGYLSDADLEREYHEAALFCYPSLEEGFGLPVLEAMIQGTLVVTSNLSCLPEVAGPAAFLADPYSVPALEEAMRKALTLSPEEAGRRCEEGLSRAASFTWKRAGEAYLRIFDELGS